MSYSQLIQFKRLEERAFIFLNGRQLLYGVLGGFGGMALANKFHLNGLPFWLAIGLLVGLGLLAGSQFRGLYIYQYLHLMARTILSRNRLVRAGDLYHRPLEQDAAYVLGAPGGQALVLRQAPVGGKRFARPAGRQSTRCSRWTWPSTRSRASGLCCNAGPVSGRGPPAPAPVVHSRPFYAGSVVEAARAASMRSEARWRAQGLRGYSRFLEQLTREAACTRPNTNSWSGPTARPRPTRPRPAWPATSVFRPARPNSRHWSRTSTRSPSTTSAARPPPALSHPAGQPRVQRRVELGGPAGNLITPILFRLARPGCRRNLPSSSALKELVKYENVLLDVLNNNRTGRDPKAEAALQDVQLAMARANAG